MDAKSSLPGDIISPLIAISGSRTLEEALQVLIETSRTETGRADLASNRTLTFVLLLIEELQKLQQSELLLLSMKLLRNLCSETTNQSLFIEGKGTEVVSKCLMTATLCAVPHCGLIRMGLQVLANASLAGLEHQNSIWVRFFPSEFLCLAKVQSQQTIDPLCMIIYACCDGNDAFLVELCGDKGLSIVAEIVRTVSLVGFRENWFKLLLSRICLESPNLPTLFSKLYTEVDGEDLKGEPLPFTTAHAFLLSIVAEILNNRLEEVTATTEFASFVLSINKKSAELIDFHSRGKSSLPTGSALTDVFGYSLVILRDICAQEGGTAVDSLLSSGFLDFVLDLLRGLEPPSIVRKAENHVQKQELVNSNVCPYKGFRRDIVGVIGNCVYRRKAVQDKIRDEDEICLLLQQCVTDEDNPFLREWGIWTVRNLVLDNEENQKEVMELKIQGSVNVPEVSELGLRVELNPETGRPKLVNCGPYDRVATKP